MNRSAMREEAFKMIYSMQIQKVENKEEQIELYIESNNINKKEAQEFIKDVAFGIEKHQENIDNQIKQNLKENWRIERISKIDLSILRLAIYEIEKKKIKYKVAINEDVEKKKKYGEDTSKNFVNGILASIVKEEKID